MRYSTRYSCIEMLTHTKNIGALCFMATMPALRVASPACHLCRPPTWLPPAAAPMSTCRSIYCRRVHFCTADPLREISVLASSQQRRPCALSSRARLCGTLTCLAANQPAAYLMPTCGNASCRRLMFCRFPWREYLHKTRQQICVLYPSVPALWHQQNAAACRTTEYQST